MTVLGLCTWLVIMLDLTVYHWRVNACWCHAGPILSTADIVHEEQYIQRGMFQDATPPGGKSCKSVGPLTQMNNVTYHKHRSKHALQHGAELS